MPCTHDTDSLSSVSSNTFSVGEVSSLEEDTPDGLGDHSNGEEIEDVIVGIDFIEAEVGESVDRKLSVVMPEMINKAVRHVRTAKAQRQYLRNCVSAANLDTNINAIHSDKHYVFICDYAQNIELPFLGDQQPGDTYYLTPKSVYVFGLTWPINTMTLLNQ